MSLEKDERVYEWLDSPDHGDVRTVMDIERLVPSRDDHSTPLWSGSVMGEHQIPKVKLFLAKNGCDGDVVLNMLSWPIISDRLRQLLSPWKENVQFLPAPLFDQNTRKEEPGYWIMNVISNCDCIDLKLSEITYFYDTDIIACFDKYRMDSKRMTGAALFRAKHTASEFFVSEAVVQTLRQADVTGVTFKEVDVI